VADEYSGIQAAVQHLTSQGHRRIGYLLMREYSPEAPLRLAGYEVALREAGIEPLPEWVWRLRGGNVAASVSFVEIGRLSMRAWLNDGFLQLGCTALLAQNDETALGAIDVLREAGLKTPDDISIIGFDGTEVAEYCSPPLTTVAMPLRDIGSKAVEIALTLMQGERMEHTPQVITLPTQLKVRETTRAPRSIEP
jgi:DNA-binding LacI/PurR family transcriptional regulator